MSKLINGPTNTYRLEGTINNKKKVLYIFMDHHNEPNRQTKCPNIRSIDIQNYLISEFDKVKKTDNMIDFFLEIEPIFLDVNNKLNKEKYIWEVGQLFSHGYKKNSDKPSTSSEFPNVRFHYMDIRNYIEEDTFKLFGEMKNLFYKIKCDSYLMPGDINCFMNGFDLITASIKKIYDQLLTKKQTIPKTKKLVPDNIDILSKYTLDDKRNIMIKIIEKIKNKYQNNDIKSIINQLIKVQLNEIEKYFDWHNKTQKKLLEYSKIIDSIDKYKIVHDDNPSVAYTGLEYKKNKEIFDFLDNILTKDNALIFFARITDLFFLRRFLDKVYVQNALVYTGGYHSIYYIYVLVKYFNFNITHCANLNSKIKNVSQLQNIVKKANSENDVRYKLYPEYIIQCSNLEHFPDLFQ
jgi:hypothetical protein